MRVPVVMTGTHVTDRLSSFRRTTVNYGRGVWGNAALNTVVMCPDLREQLEGQGVARFGRHGAATGPALPGRPCRVPRSAARAGRFPVLGLVVLVVRGRRSARGVLP
ncbi:hypothetical protein GCM10009549_55230 [Streptomyces thermoalcalitolerans]|uniref:Uncharacterized protein n=1 Tax=Streptomyces thermoalcalitolerans TaxID=65605 RepID=A0ABP4A4G2_9ACTN